jgi:hypothetical protein
MKHQNSRLQDEKQKMKEYTSLLKLQNTYQQLFDTCSAEDILVSDGSLQVCDNEVRLYKDTVVLSSEHNKKKIFSFGTTFILPVSIRYQLRKNILTMALVYSYNEVKKNKTFYFEL